MQETSYRSIPWQAKAACWSMPIEDLTMNQVHDEEVAHLAGDNGIVDTMAVRRWNEEKVEKALAACKGCPVLDSCLSSATPADLYWTVRGGEKPKMLTRRGPTGAKVHFPDSDAGEYLEFRCKRNHQGDHLKFTYPNGKRACSACRAEDHEARKSATLEV